MSIDTNEYANQLLAENAQLRADNSALRQTRADLSREANKLESERDEARAELAHRDAAAGEPVAWAHRLINRANAVAGTWVYGSAEREPTEGALFRVEVMPLYAAAQPAAQDAPGKVYQIRKLDGSEEWQQWCEVSATEYYGSSNEGWRRRILYTSTAAPVSELALPELFTTIGENIRTQDNRCTANPMFCVFEKVPTPAAEGYNDTRIEWYDSDHERSPTPLQTARLESLYQGGRCDDNDYGPWRRLAMCDIDRFVTACFTAEGCKAYLAQNGHNLRSPFVYVTSAYRNDEYQAVREWLMQLEAAPAPGGNDAN